MRFSTAIHDLRVSGGKATEDSIVRLREILRVPLTVHLVFDAPLSSQPSLRGVLRDGAGAGHLELVFHGLTHACPAGVGRFTSFYHKGQAEYLFDADSLRTRTREVWEEGLEGFETPIGICPPCWMATRTNWTFLESLSPLYLETAWSLRTDARTVPSPIVSLGSPNPTELFWLRPLGSALRRLADLPGLGNLRVALHTCDLDRRDSMDYFVRTVSSLLDRGASPRLQRELLDGKAILPARA